MTRRAIETAIHVALLVLVLCLAGAAWYWSSSTTKHLAAAGARAERANAVLRTSADLRAHLLEAELGVRSYVLTHRPGFLNAYDVALRLIPTQMADLRAAAFEPGTRELAASLDPLIQERLTALRLFTQLPRTASVESLKLATAAVERNARGQEGVTSILDELERRATGERALAARERADVGRAATVGAALQGALSIFAVVAVFMLLLRQVRERRAAEEGKEGTEDLMALVFDSIPEGVIVADVEGKALVFNPAVEVMFGGRPPQADSGKWHEIRGLFHADGRTPLAVDEMPLVRALRGEETSSLELCVKTQPDGSCRYLSATGSPLRAPDGSVRGGVVVFSDFTSRRKADAEIRRLNRDLQSTVSEMSMVNQELESFTSSVSHGLRAPLRAVDGFSRLLAAKASEDPEQARLLSVIRVNAARMGRLMDDLLAYVDLLRRPLRGARVDMAALARSSFEEAERACGLSGKLTVEPMPAARGDPELLRELWQNLVSNALKFSRAAKPPIVVVGTAGGNGKTVYFVRDNGVGFSMRYAHRLFGVFQRLHGTDEFEGAGVGLAIARRIVERHGGQIWANAEEGRGATFYFTLPTSEGEDDDGSASS